MLSATATDPNRVIEIWLQMLPEAHKRSGRSNAQVRQAGGVIKDA